MAAMRSYNAAHDRTGNKAGAVDRQGKTRTARSGAYGHERLINKGNRIRLPKCNHGWPISNSSRRETRGSLASVLRRDTVLVPDYKGNGGETRILNMQLKINNL
jgi:hypothetical protein